MLRQVREARRPQIPQKVKRPDERQGEHARNPKEVASASAGPDAATRRRSLVHEHALPEATGSNDSLESNSDCQQPQALDVPEPGPEPVQICDQADGLPAKTKPRYFVLIALKL